MPFVNGEFVWARADPKPPLTPDSHSKCRKDDMVLSNSVSSLLDLDNPKEPIGYSDFTVEVGDTKFNVHLNILSARSEVFKAMFGYDFIEKKSGHIKITEFDVDVVKTVLCYIYGQKPKFKISRQSIQDILDVLRAADFYQLPGLVTICENLLVLRFHKFKKMEASPDFCELLSVAYNCRTPRLMMELAIKYCKFTDTIKELENFDQLGEILKRNLEALSKSYSTTGRKRGLIDKSCESQWPPSRLFELDEFAVIGASDIFLELDAALEPDGYIKKETIPLTTSKLDQLRINERVTPENTLIADVHFVWRINNPRSFTRMPENSRIDTFSVVTNQELDLHQYGIKLRLNCFVNHLRHFYPDSAPSFNNNLLFGISYEQEWPLELNVRMALQLIGGYDDRHLKFQENFWTYRQKDKTKQRHVFRISKSDVPDNPFDNDKSMNFRVELEVVLDKNLLFWSDLEQRMHVTMMKDNIWAMYEQGMHSDFKLTGGGEDFKVHRNILNIRSGILTKAKGTKAITIPKVSSNSIHKLVEYLYTDTITAMDIGTARELLGVAFDYDIPALGSKCEVYLVNELKVGNACESIRLAQGYKAKALEKQAVITIGKNFDRLWRTSDCKDVLSELLELCNPATAKDEGDESESDMD